MSRYYEINIDNWQHIHILAESLNSFAFRGQADASWDLTTSLERCFKKYDPVIPIYENKEHWVLHEFREKFHLYSNHPPEISNHFEWLALLQHHGCPTRLLDFSDSLYIASYFAISESISDAAIWAINLYSLRGQLHEKLSLPYEKDSSLKDETNKHHVNLINKYIAKDSDLEKPYFVVPLRSSKRSIRLSCQKGLFIAPINMGGIKGGQHFMKNLALSFGSEDEVKFSPLEFSEYMNKLKVERPVNSIDVLKIRLSEDMHRYAIQSLGQMNISEESLFHGLDGLARSLIHTEIRY